MNILQKLSISKTSKNISSSIKRIFIFTFLIGFNIFGFVSTGFSQQIVSISGRGGAGFRNYGFSAIALKSDGTVWTWGFGTFGQNGDGLFRGRYTPGMVSGVSDITAVAAGGAHNVVLKSDGTGKAWGFNLDGQLGNGTPNPFFPPFGIGTPVDVVNLDQIVAVDAGNTHTLALKSDGTVWAWGSNSAGQLGRPATTAKSAVPLQVPGLSGITAIACGWSHNLALKRDGTVWAWGSNYRGQLGTGTATSKAIRVPKKVRNLTAVAIAAGSTHSFALKANGTVAGWGDNSSGQLGRGLVSAEPKPNPITAINLTRVVSITCGYTHTAALTQDGKVWIWGFNASGQLGNGTLVDTSVPRPMSNLDHVTFINCGLHSTYAIKNDGTVWAWGYNGVGALGDGTTINRSTPVQISF